MQSYKRLSVWQKIVHIHFEYYLYSIINIQMQIQIR